VNVIDFFEYLAAHEATAELAYDLADVWAAQEAAEQRAEPAA
jgi:hypothetical protein